MCTELENAIEAVEKLRTVVWANQPASMTGDNAVALARRGRSSMRSRWMRSGRSAGGLFAFRVSLD